jgi:hypothetical protein
LHAAVCCAQAHARVSWRKMTAMDDDQDSLESEDLGVFGR